MAKFKHNKLKNTGMLFEFLLRQVTVDVLNKKKTSKAVQIIKKRFNENTEVGKELGLYNLLLKKKFEDDKKADFFLAEILRQRGKLNKTDLSREKYNIIKEINQHYDSKNLFSAKLDNYKQYASIYKLFEGNEKLSPDDKTDSYFIIMENITTINTQKNTDYLPKDLKDKDVRILSYKILLEKFNEKYTKLTANQKLVLKEYINSISNSNEFNKFVNSKLPTLKKSLKSRVKNVKNEVLKIKLTEAINCVDKFCLNESKTTKDDSVVQLLRYYELDKELKKIQ
jgi:hypothetical protein